jgi:hypothetical protein
MTHRILASSLASDIENTSTYTTAEPGVEAVAFEHVTLFRPSEYPEMREPVLVFEMIGWDDDTF